MSNIAINSRFQNATHVFNCRKHGEVLSKHDRCPKCYLERMKNYSTSIRMRNRNSNLRNRPRTSSESESVSENLFLPPIVRPQSEPIPDVRLLRRNLNFPVIEHPPLPRLPSIVDTINNRISNRRRVRNVENFDISNMLSIQRRLTENQIRNISLENTSNKSVNLQVLSRDTTISKAPECGNCAICQEDWENDEVVRKLPCNHVFHIMCIDRWFASNNVCPICRYEMKDN